MTIGFNSGSKYFDNYLEAYYEVIKCYYEGLESATIEGNTFFDYSSLYDTLVMPVAEALAGTIEGQFSSPEWNDYYENLYTTSYFRENNWATIWDGYDITNCDVLSIIDRWGFKGETNQNIDSGTFGLIDDSVDGIIVAPAKYKKRNANKIASFDPLMDKLRIDVKTFAIEDSLTFAAGKNKKTVKKKLAKQDIDFLYDQKKGSLYFNENGPEKGFGNGGIVAILVGAPVLTESNIEFI